jgi:hypothetical protein
MIIVTPRNLESERNRFLKDWLLERSGFELSVPLTPSETVH